MSRWFAPSLTRKAGWLVVELDGKNASYAHGRADPGGKTLISFYGRRSIEGPADLQRLAKDLSFSRYRCITLLQPGDYQLIQLEAPDVPAAERKTALRWRLKDLLDFPLEEATFDVLDIPGAADSGGKTRTVYAVATRSELVRSCIDRFEDANIPLSVIDVRETAQRNIGALSEDPERGLALLFVGEDTCLLTVNFRQELLLTRRIDIGRAQLAGPSGSDEAIERIGLEVQRTLDLVDRQFPFVSVSKVLLAPQPDDTGLPVYLQQNLGVRSAVLDLAEVFGFEGPTPPDRAAQWSMFHLLGATLRQ
jgi:MSHA biogenesis protein MshI